MTFSGQRDLWDVRYILPKGNQVIYRRVQLHDIDALVKLTHEVATTSIKEQCKPLHLFYESSQDCFIPGFIVHHLPSKALGHFDPILLKPNEACWNSLLQRQGGETLITLRIVPKDNHVGFSGRSLFDPLSSSPLAEKIEIKKPTSFSFSNEVDTENGQGDVPKTLGKNAGDSANKEAIFSPAHFPTSSFLEPRMREFGLSPAPEASREYQGEQQESQSMSLLLSHNGKTFEGTPSLTVRKFALHNVLMWLLPFQRKGNDSKGGVEETYPLLTRAGILYFAAAVVKVWQLKLVLSPAAMREAWTSFPPLVREAQCDYLKSVFREFWSRFCKATQLKVRRQLENRELMPLTFPHSHGQELSLAKEKAMGIKGAEQLSPLIEEVTYCSSAGPRTLPIGNVAKGHILLSLSAPPQVSTHEEVVILGRVYSSNPIGLFWWLLERGLRSHSLHSLSDDQEYVSMVSLDALYREHRIATFQITPHTFVLTVKPGSLESPRRYRFVLEACDIRTGDVAVSEVNVCTMLRP